MNEGMSLNFFSPESGREQSERLKLQSSRPVYSQREFEFGVSNSVTPDKPESSRAGATYIYKQLKINDL